MDLPSIISLIQGEVGTRRDGKIGPVTAAAVLAALRTRHMDPEAEKEMPVSVSQHFELDARTESILATLDPKAVPMFREFMCLAKGTAASLGYDYVLVGGTRTWADQDALYAQGRTTPGKIVTNAPGGFGFHNLKLAVDAGVFAGKIYLDDGTAEQQARASKVHAACSQHAQSCGLVSGRSWVRMPDEPHYQVDVGHTSPTAADRAEFLKEGSIL